MIMALIRVVSSMEIFPVSSGGAWVMGIIVLMALRMILPIDC
jgi:hypothetical protein